MDYDAWLAAHGLEAIEKVLGARPRKQRTGMRTGLKVGLALAGAAAAGSTVRNTQRLPGGFRTKIGPVGLSHTRTKANGVKTRTSGVSVGTRMTGGISFQRESVTTPRPPRPRRI